MTAASRASVVADLREMALHPVYFYGGVDLGTELRLMLSQLVPDWCRSGRLVSVPAAEGSYSLVMTRLDAARMPRPVWDDPISLAGLVLMSGTYADLCAYNAVRTLRPAVRRTKDSLLIARPNFQDVVADAFTDPQGPVPWGDLPLPGAVIREDDTEMVVLAVQGFSPRQNHTLAAAAAEFVLGVMADCRRPGC